MPAYIALLRGINVSGQKLIKMERLREVLSQSGLLHVRTYIQSGNILFESEIMDISELQELISSTIKQAFAYNVPVAVFTAGKLRKVISNNPFLKETAIDPTQPYVAFLSQTPQPEHQRTLANIDFAPDRFKIESDVVYLHYTNSAGRSKLTNAIIEKKLHVSGTMRNWKTVAKLLEMGETDHQKIQ